MIILILILVFAGLAAALKSGVQEASQEAFEHDAAKRNIHRANVGCWGVVFCAIGVAGVLALISIAFPGQ